MKKVKFPDIKFLTVFVLLFAGIGSYLLMQSHAATVPYSQFLTYTNAAQTTGVGTSTDYVNQIGTQTVSQVAAGGQLTYVVGGKVAIKSMCYFLRAVNPKGVGNTATVELTNQYKSIVISLPIAAEYQEYCVGTAKNGSLKPYNVYNKSAQDGPQVLIYQTVVNY